MPANPGAWLTVTAKRRAIDRIRRDATLARKQPLLESEILASLDAGPPDPAAAVDEEISDDLLRMLFTACHPALPRTSQVALTLRMVGGLTTDEIARAYVTATPTIVRRISRAKKTIRDQRIPYEVPSGAELAVRLDAVLEVVYLVFNEGYAATAGDGWMRIDLSAPRRCGSHGSSAACCPPNPRSRASRRCSNCRRPDCAPDTTRPGAPCCCATRTAPGGIAC